MVGDVCDAIEQDKVVVPSRDFGVLFGICTDAGESRMLVDRIKRWGGSASSCCCSVQGARSSPKKKLVGWRKLGGV